MDAVTDQLVSGDRILDDLDEPCVQHVQRPGDRSDLGLDADRVGPIRGTDR